jgi:hypothetical protein
MDLGLLGVELETYGRMAPKIRHEGIKPGKRVKSRRQPSQKAHNRPIFSQPRRQRRHLDWLINSSPTGC